MSRPMIPDDQVEMEIQRLKQSPYVKLSHMEQRLKADRRRKYLADLRWHEKRGRQLEELGVTMDNMEDMLAMLFPVEGDSDD